MSKAVVAFIAVALAIPAAAKANPQQSCMLTYFKARSAGCVDEIVALAAQLPENARTPSNNIVGFLGELFRQSPQEKQRVLAAPADPVTQTMKMAALYRAGLADEASQFADANGLSNAFTRLSAAGVPVIAKAKPHRSPGENDLLIGAYSASGNRAHLVRILDNFRGVDDAMTADAMRLALLMGKFGSSFAPHWRKSSITRNACEKYSCNTDRSRFMHVLTLSSGLWALQALGRNDETVRSVLNDFLASRQNLKSMWMAEQAVFGNYLTALVALQALDGAASQASNPQVLDAMKRSADAYESLESPAASFQPMTALKKQQ